MFTAENISEKLLTHAANPTAIKINDNIYRVYYSARDNKQRASISFIDISFENKEVKIIKISHQPVLEPGSIGAFDDSGVSVGCVLKVGSQFYMYYLGWNLGVTVPWRNSIGLAISDNGEDFTRVQLSPILDRNKVDPFSISYPWVMKEGDLWHMWYGSNLEWGDKQEDMAHLLKYASSKNGIDWDPSGEISVEFNNDNEYAMSKPCVIKTGSIYRMWYSYRGESYRIGYAESTDGIHFTRKDNEVGIDVSITGWDSETIEYPNIIIHNGEYYMFYNGNRYGMTGFGIAKGSKIV